MKPEQAAELRVADGLTAHASARCRVWFAPELASESPENWLREGEDRLWQCAMAAGDRVLGTGRAQARAVKIGDVNGVWRRNRHGGLLGNMQGDRYRTTERLEAEVTLSARLQAAGLRTPSVALALAVKRAGFWRQNLVTHEVVGAQTVFHARASEAALEAAAQLLEQSFAVGLWATDLHPDNMLWRADDEHPEGGQCWLIDLAGARLRGRPLNPREAAARRLRFARYFQKHAGDVPARFRVD